MRTHGPTLQHRFEYVCWKFMETLLHLLPRRLHIVLADLAGSFLHKFFKVRRREMEENLRIAFGDTMSARQRDELALRTWQNLALTFFEFVSPTSYQGPGWEQSLQKEGFEHLQRLMKSQAIIISGHIGNWEMIGTMGAKFGLRPVGLAKQMHNPLVGRAILRERERQGVEVIFLQRNMKAAIDAMRKGKWVGLLGDQDARRSGIFVEFFNRPASTAEGPALFAWKMNLPLLPCFCVRQNDRERSLKLIIHPPIYPDPSAPRDEEVRRMTEAHVQALEQVIKASPADYFWLHRRWKSQPKGKQKISPEKGSVE